jgi:hypothetical protein
MNLLPVPKIMKWDWNLSQKYSCDRKILVTSGCSFTSSTLILDCASSWPGYMRDRCRFDHAVDWSYPGAGNLYISDSIINYIKSLSKLEKQNLFVAVMWSGIDREENVIKSARQPCINGISYQRKRISQDSKHDQAISSYNYIIKTKQYLENQNIPFAFTFYINLLFPPCLPRRDTTHNFESFLDHTKLQDLKKFTWVPDNPKDYLYDFSFYRNYLDQSTDQYHPTGNCVLDWTDNIWLPALEKRRLICNTQVPLDE